MGNIIIKNAYFLRLFILIYASFILIDILQVYSHTMLYSLLPSWPKSSNTSCRTGMAIAQIVTISIFLRSNVDRLPHYVAS